MSSNRIKSKLHDEGLGEAADAHDLTRARATLKRLADINARFAAEMEKVLQEAQELRRQLLDDARTADHDGNS